MANRYRPKGSYKDYLNLNANDLSGYSEAELRGIVIKLNETANKRLERLQKSGLQNISPSLWQRKPNKRFSTPKEAVRLSTKKEIREYRKSLKEAYQEAREFINDKTSSVAETKKYMAKFEDYYNDLVEKAMEDEANLDKRYKNPTLKKSVRDDVITDFWDRYHKWRELYVSAVPSEAELGTNISDSVDYFYEEVYSNDLNIGEQQSLAKEIYKKKEEEKLANEEDNISVPTPTPNGGRKGKTRKGKLTTEGKGIKIKTRFADIKIY